MINTRLICCMRLQVPICCVTELRGKLVFGIIMTCIEVSWSPSPVSPPYRSIIQVTSLRSPIRGEYVYIPEISDQAQSCWWMLCIKTEQWTGSSVLTCFQMIFAPVVCINCCLTDVIPDFAVLSARISGNLYISRMSWPLFSLARSHFDYTVWFSESSPQVWRPITCHTLQSVCSLSSNL